MNMKDHDIKELKKRLSRAEAQTKNLLDELVIKNRTIQLLIIAEHLDKDKLQQATELAGGI